MPPEIWHGIKRGAPKLWWVGEGARSAPFVRVCEPLKKPIILLSKLFASCSELSFCMTTMYERICELLCIICQTTYNVYNWALAPLHPCAHCSVGTLWFKLHCTVTSIYISSGTAVFFRCWGRKHIKLRILLFFYICHALALPKIPVFYRSCPLFFAKSVKKMHFQELLRMLH